MTLRINHNSGKGSNRRSTQDDYAYLNNYDLIFGKSKDDAETFKVQPKFETVVTDKATWETKKVQKKPSFVSIKDAPSVLNLQDKAMWVIGWNEAVKALEDYYADWSD